VPHWMTAAGVALGGDWVPERSYRIGSILVATLAVLIFAWAVAGCLGRSLGLMSGAILATMREFTAYATGPEADIFLASTVTIAGSLLLQILFNPSAKDQKATFFGGRSWAVLLFFALLGSMNAMKGPLFGLFFVLLPFGAYVAWGRNLRELRPLIWSWGWLVALMLALAWPIAAYMRYPDILELWAVDYGRAVE